MGIKKDIQSTSSDLGGTSSISEAKNEKVKNPSQTEVVNLQMPKIVRKHQGKVLNVIGDHQNIKLTGKDTNGQYTLIEQNNEPEDSIPPHVHENEDEVFQVLEGIIEMKIGDEKSILNAGDLVFCPKRIPHTWKVIGNEKSKVMLGIFPAGLEVMFEELSQLPSGPPDMERIGQICGKYNVRIL